MEQIRTKIRQFISNSLSYDLHDDEDLFALGFVKSLFILQLVLFIEREFDLKIENVHRNIDSFRTVNSIAELVECNSDLVLEVGRRQPRLALAR